MINKQAGERAGVDLSAHRDERGTRPLVAPLQLPHMIHNCLSIDRVTPTRSTPRHRSPLTQGKESMCCGLLNPPGPTRLHIVQRGGQRRR
ncbi:hypothetical protein [Streptomyces djakartensis]|uniref:hypothetical protein n=1 Tax=Streptomyces djakartensis TaxID=68193 RepID=UPI0034DE1F55